MTDTIKPSHADILGAVARGWCHPQNSAKEMDSDLANAIAGEVQDAIDAAVAQERAEAERLQAALREGGIVLLPTQARAAMGEP